VSVAARVLANSRANGFAGYDPFDFLNSKLFSRSPFARSSFARLAWIQLGKRLPINLRRALLVPQVRNPKGIALFILGLCEDYERTNDEESLHQAVKLGRWLVNSRCDPSAWDGACWGYPFDWQARAFFVPKGRPNVIATVYVARALERLGALTSVEEFQFLALRSADFISRHLLVGGAARPYFAYIPGQAAFVHNASLWGAAWCTVAGSRLGRRELVDLGVQVAHTSAAEQRADGSWIYGNRSHHGFVDGFHTGYNVESLRLVCDYVEDAVLERVCDAGYRFYIEHCFDDAHTAKYYANETYPVDTHSVAQAIVTILKVDGGVSRLDLCRRILDRSMKLLYRPSAGLFAYQRGKYVTNTVNYSRWTQAWAYYSLALFNRHSAGG
jgi:polysaccharide biosynthesis protein VpsJ